MTASELDLARRVDWRFLLSDARLGKVACLGPVPDGLRSALECFALSVNDGDADNEQIPAQDLYLVTLSNGYSFAARGSGTEPKMKFYLFASEPVASAADLPAKASASSTSTRSQTSSRDVSHVGATRSPSSRRKLSRRSWSMFSSCAGPPGIRRLGRDELVDERLLPW